MFLDLGDQPHCNRLIAPSVADKREPYFPLRTHFCKACTMVQIDHTIAKESMFTDYPYVSGTTKTLVQHFKDTAERLVKTYGLKPGDLVVDLGSNDGSWLKQYQPLGMRVLGVDPAKNVVELARKAGVPTWDRFFNNDVAKEMVAAEGQAKLMTASGVFFHLEELHSVVDGVGTIIGYDGVFVVQAIYLGGMIDNLAFDQIYHEHLVYYTLKSLQHLLGQHGLEIFDCSIVNIHGGSIEAHVAKKGRRPIQKSVADMAAVEAKKKYGELSTYHQFAKDVWRLRDELLAVLEKYQREGKSVYAMGAPAKGATLVNSFGIGPRLVQKATERNAMKFGFMMPGSRIPIVDEEKERPDAYLILAWNFIDEIAARYRDYLNSGGEFITPIPKLKVIKGERAS
jgi:hypothetical protein